MRFQILAILAYLVAITRAALPPLETYKVGDPTLKKLYCEMSQQKWRTNDEALELLKEESSKIPTAKSQFHKALNGTFKCPDYMLKSECIAVVMYSSNLYKDFNEKLRSGNLESYKILAALLHSAVVKMSKMYSSKGATVYRGMKEVFAYPKDAFYFKQFTSTSFKQSTAKVFNGHGKLLKFEIAPNSLVAKISDISMFPSEEELLISPFQAIQFVGDDKEYINFKSVDAKITCP